VSNILDYTVFIDLVFYIYLPNVIDSDGDAY